MNEYRRRHTRWNCDWSSDVCSSDLYANSAETQQILQDTKPISIIRLEGFSGLPAADLIAKFKIKDQNDPHLEHATQELYSKEFHDGIKIGRASCRERM